MSTTEGQDVDALPVRYGSAQYRLTVQDIDVANMQATVDVVIDAEIPAAASLVCLPTPVLRAASTKVIVEPTPKPYMVASSIEPIAYQQPVLLLAGPSASDYRIRISLEGAVVPIQESSAAESGFALRLPVGTSINSAKAICEVELTAFPRSVSVESPYLQAGVPAESLGTSWTLQGGSLERMLSDGADWNVTLLRFGTPYLQLLVMVVFASVPGVFSGAFLQRWRLHGSIVALVVGLGLLALFAVAFRADWVSLREMSRNGDLTTVVGSGIGFSFGLLFAGARGVLAHFRGARSPTP